MTPSLTRRQSQVCRLVCRGLSNKGVARKLGISARTAETYRHQVFRHYGVHSALHLVLKINGLPMETA